MPSGRARVTRIFGISGRKDNLPGRARSRTYTFQHNNIMWSTDTNYLFGSICRFVYIIVVLKDYIPVLYCLRVVELLELFYFLT